MLVAELLLETGAACSRPHPSLPAGFQGNFWIQVGTGRTVTTSGPRGVDEHVDAVIHHPEWFGFDRTDLEDQFPDAMQDKLVDEEGEDVDYMGLYDYTTENGWVRASYGHSRQELNLDADSLRDALSVLRIILKTHLVATLYVSLAQPHGLPGTSSDRNIHLEGDAVARFARSGAVPRAA